MVPFTEAESKIEAKLQTFAHQSGCADREYPFLGCEVLIEP
jgi:hypothetical protein